MATRQTRSSTRPQPGPRDYTQPPPGGPTYPWSPGGNSKVPGVPDNWQDYYPSEQAGRGDSWLGVKFGPGGPYDRSKPFTPGPPAPQNKYSPQYEDWLKQNGLFGWKGHQGFMDQQAAYKAQEDPRVTAATPHDTTLTALKLHGVQPGPINRPGQGQIGTYNGQQINYNQQQQQAPQTGPGSAQAWNKLYASQQKKGAPAAATPPDYAKIRGGMKPGQTVKQGGKSYFLNEKGALVDVSDPKARKRLTDIQGNVLGAKPAAAPPTTPTPTTPPPTPQTQPAATPPAADPNAIPPWAQQLQDSFAQLQQGMQRPNFYPGVSPRDLFGGGMMQGYGGGMGGGMYQPMQNFMGGFGQGYGGGMGNSLVGNFGGPGSYGGGGYNIGNYLGGYTPEVSMMNPYNPNMQMYY